MGVLGEGRFSGSDCENGKSTAGIQEKDFAATPQQSPQPGAQRQMEEVEEQEFGACGKYEGNYWWTARGYCNGAEQYLNESDNKKVETEELELLLGPKDSEVDLRFTVMNARRTKVRRFFQIFSSQSRSEFLVVGAPRWDEYSNGFA